MAHFRQHYTLRQAREMLPWVQKNLTRAQVLINELEQAQVALREIHKLIQSNGKGSGHPDFGTIIGEIQEIVAEFNSREIAIKDLERGLIDFPHFRGREEVFLCYLLGEDDIGFWHSLDEGFSGRLAL